MKKILFYGETSKNAVHGISISNDLFIKDLQASFNIKVINEQSNLSEHGAIGYSKVRNLCLALLSIWAVARRDSFDYFYSVLSVSVQGIFKSLLMLICLKLASSKTKLIIHVHRGDLSDRAEQSFILLLLFKFTIKLVDNVVLISKKQVEDYNKVSFLGAKKYVYVANSIDTIEYANELNHQHKSSYLYLSNYLKEKGIFDLLSVWKGLPSDCRLRCFGGETPDASVGVLKQQFNLKNVEFSQAIYNSKKYSVIASSKAVILPSWNEGAPLVLLEAMSLGVPVIASDVGFISEMLGNDYPFLFEAKNCNSIRDAILKFEAYSKQDQVNIGLSLKKQFYQEYSRESRISDYMSVFS